MMYLPDTEADRLLEEARLASMHSYSPYSEFVVGAAVLTEGGLIYHGTNIENASFGLTICAERIALGNVLSAGLKDIVAIAVYADTDSVSPCGACRQFIIEFGANIIVIFRQDQKVVQKYIHELLPYQFKMPA